jgi:hypothetical protein
MTMLRSSEDDPSKWRLRKEVAIGDLLAFVTAFAAVIVAYTTLDRRLAIIESVVLAQHERDSRQDAEFLRYQQRIDESLREMNRKLDRLIERKT